MLKTFSVHYCNLLTCTDIKERAVARVLGNRLCGSAEGGHCEPACAARIVLAAKHKYGHLLHIPLK